LNSFIVILAQFYFSFRCVNIYHHVLDILVEIFDFDECFRSDLLEFSNYCLAIVDPLRQGDCIWLENEFDPGMRCYRKLVNKFCCCFMMLQSTFVLAFANRIATRDILFKNLVAFVFIFNIN
jgi:hypothetical protein